MREVGARSSRWRVSMRSYFCWARAYREEVVARMIHKLSGRSAHKFLKVNCAALPLELLESELFGHEAGAFTSARQARAGKFEICHKGTILLDEVAEMPLSPQAKLLHVLQDGEFSRRAAPVPSTRTCACSLPPMSTCARPCRTGPCAPISTIGSMCFQSICCRCASGAKTCPTCSITS